MRVNRAVSPVISVILMVAIVVVLVATASVFIFDSGLGVDEPAPFVADTTGEFDPEGDGNPYIARCTASRLVQKHHKPVTSVENSHFH